MNEVLGGAVAEWSKGLLLREKINKHHKDLRFDLRHIAQRWHQFSEFPKKYFYAAEIYRQPWLEESGHRLENVDEPIYNWLVARKYYKNTWLLKTVAGLGFLGLQAMSSATMRMI